MEFSDLWRWSGRVGCDCFSCEIEKFRGAHVVILKVSVIEREDVIVLQLVRVREHDYVFRKLWIRL